MATSGLYGSSPTGAVISAPGSESAGLYGNGTTFGGSYFEWFIFIQADTQPATPTGGSWSFQTNSGTPPTGWSSSPPAAPTLPVWVSIALVNSRDSGALVWSAPGVFSYSSGLPILSGSGSPTSGDGLNNQLWIQTGTTPETIWFKQSGTWVRLTGSTLYVDTTSNQTIAGTKTFSDVIVGSVSGTSNNVTGIVSITNGGTGATSANSAFNALAPSQTGNSGKYLTTNGTDTSWATNPLGTVTSVSGTGTVSGVTLSGTVTTSGSLTLGGSLDLSSPPAIGGTARNSAAFTTELVGPSASANFTRFPNALSVVSNVASGIQHNESAYIGQMAEGVSVGSTWGIGVYGAGYTNSTGTGRGTGVTGEGHVSASADTGVAVGVRGYATDTHTGNYNIGLYGDAENGDTGLTYGGNVALFLANGNIVTSAAATKTWYMGGNITFDGQGSAKTISATNGAVISISSGVTGTLPIANGGTGQTTANAAFNALAPSQTGNSGKYLTTDGSNTSWAANPLGTVTSVSGTGTVSGISLSGTVTTSGSLTLGGTLDLSAYNGVGAFSSLSVSGTTTLGGNISLQNNSASSQTPKYIQSNAFGGAIRFSANSATADDRNVQLGTVNNAGTFASYLEVGDNYVTVQGLTVGKGGGAVSTNTVLGVNSLASNVSGLRNTFVGYTAGRYTTGSYNVGVGHEALNANTTGSQNTAIGDVSLVSNTTASGNTAVGWGAMLNNSTGAQNTVIGNQAGYNNSTGTLNVAVGDNAFYSNTTGSNNTAIGRQALRSNTTASQNTAVGYQSGYSNQTGTNGVYIGYSAGYSTTLTGFVAVGYLAGYNKSSSDTYASVFVGSEAGTNITSGTDNTIIGGYAGRYLTTGVANTAVGSAALGANSTSTGSGNTAVGAFWSGVIESPLYYNTTGAANVAMGSGALRANTTGSFNVGIGTGSFAYSTTSSNNVAVGFQSGYSNTTGTYMTYLGTQAGYAKTTGFSVTAIGYRALYNNTADNNTAVGTTTLLSNTTGQYNIAVGEYALGSNTSGSYNTSIGQDALRSNTTASNNTAVGYYAGYSNTTGTDITSFGAGALVFNTTGSYNTAVGREALRSNTTASNNTAVGYQSLFANTTGTTSVAIGHRSLYNSNADRNTGIGYFAGSAITTGAFNTAIGSQAMGGSSNVVTGSDNIAIGSWHDGVIEGPLAYLSSGSYNIAIGNAAMRLTTTGSSNTAVGNYALTGNSTGSNNTSLGGNALQNNTTASNNTAVGYSALYTNTTGAQNVAFGYQAGRVVTTGNWNTLIGVQAGTNLTTGSANTFVGASGSSGAGNLMTTGSANTILGGFSGNQNSVDIRTSTNNIVISDGDGYPRAFYDNAYSGWKYLVLVSGQQYNTSYTTDGSWTSLQTVIPVGTLSASGGGSYIWLINLCWIFGSGGSSPYYANAAFLMTVTNCNSTGTGTVISLFTSSHVPTGTIDVAPTYALSSTTGLAVKFTGFATQNGTLTVKASLLATP